MGLTGTPVPLPLGEVASRSDDGEGKPVSREPPCSDKLSLWESDAIAVPALLRQRPCPLRRSAPALPKGEPLAKRAGFAGCKSLSLWERWHRAAITERASPSPESRHAAISRFFERAKLCPNFSIHAGKRAIRAGFIDFFPADVVYSKQPDILRSHHFFSPFKGGFCMLSYRKLAMRVLGRPIHTGGGVSIRPVQPLSGQQRLS